MSRTQTELDYDRAVRECDDAWRWAAMFSFDHEVMTAFRRAHQIKMAAWKRVRKERNPAITEAA